LAVFNYPVRTPRQSSESGRRFLVLLFAAAIPLLCHAQEQYKSVETSDLLKTPQKYWARPIVFKDTLTEPPEDARVDIEGKRYAAFSTRDIGVCYASADLLPAMSALEANREYLFSGTVFQHRGRYVPVIQSYTPAINAQKLSADIKTVAEETPDAFTNESVRPMADLLAAVQSAQVAYAKEKNIPLCQLYDPTSEHFVKAMDIARTAIYSSEQKNNTASAEILAQYLSTVLAKQCAPASATQTEMEAESPPIKQEPSVRVDEVPAPSNTNVAPNKLSWSERKAIARAKKEAERKAKKERDDALAAEKAARKKTEEAAAEYQAQQEALNEASETAEEPPQAATVEIQEAPEEPAPVLEDTEPKAAREPDAAQAAEDAARKAVMEYEAQRKMADLSPETASEPTQPAGVTNEGASAETSPTTNTSPVAESSDQKPATISWFQRWKMERQKRAIIDAELRRIEQEKEEAAQRLKAEKKAEERRQAEMKEAEEQKLAEQKKAEELKKQQESERLKAEAKKAKAAAAKKAAAEKTQTPAPSNGNGIYSPVGR
jgi:hypothetical protein